jgi:hypothetical protein
MSYIAKLGQEFGQYVVQLTGQLLLSNQSPKSLSEMERQIREKLLETEVRLDIVSRLQVDPASLAEGPLCGTGRNGRLAPPLSDDTLGALAFQFGKALGWDQDQTRTNFEKVAGVKFDELTGARLQATVRRE